jgi:hypothetical protein
MNAASEIAWFVGGALLVLWALDSAIRGFVLPRGSVVRLNRIVFVVIRKVFDLRLRFAKTYEQQDRVMALYAPIALLMLPVTWLVLVLVGFMGMFRATGIESWRDAFRESGSSLFTLGYVPLQEDFPRTILGFTEAAIGLGLLAVLISFLPAMYSAFSQREAAVAHWAARAGEPPSPLDFLVRAQMIGTLEELDDVWETWQRWFAELEETHTSLAPIVFFRSPSPHRSWVTAAGTVLDSASLVNSTVDVPWQPMASLTVRAGFVALRRIGDFFDVEYDPDPTPTDPISIAREEFDDLYRRLQEAGVPVKPDRDQAWRDFAGWRVNYDAVLLALASLTTAPYAEWVSDRSIRYRLNPLRRRPH